MKKQFIIIFIVVVIVTASFFALDKLYLTKKEKVDNSLENREAVIPSGGVPYDKEYAVRLAEQATTVVGTVSSINSEEIEVTDKEGNKNVRKLTPETYYEKQTIPQKIEAYQTPKREKLAFEDVKVGDEVLVIANESQSAGLVSVVIRE